MLNLVETLISTQKDLVVLQTTHKITKVDLKEEKYIWLKKQYDDIEKAPITRSERTLLRYSASFINSILTQNRIVFVVTRKQLARLIQQDDNHSSGFDNNLYETFTTALLKWNYVRVIQEADRTKPFIYEVTNKDILGFLADVDRDAQFEQTQRFTNQTSKADIKADIVSKYESKSVLNAGFYNYLINDLLGLDKSTLSDDELNFIQNNNNPEKALTLEEMNEAVEILLRHNISIQKSMDSFLSSVVNSDLEVNVKFEHLKSWGQITDVKPDVEFQEYFKKLCNIQKLSELVDYAFDNMKVTSWITPEIRNYLHNPKIEIPAPSKSSLKVV